MTGLEGELAVREGGRGGEGGRREVTSVLVLDFLLGPESSDSGRARFLDFDTFTGFDSVVLDGVPGGLDGMLSA